MSDADYSLGDELEDLEHTMTDDLSNYGTGLESLDTSEEEPYIAFDLELHEDELVVLEKDLSCKFDLDSDLVNEDSGFEVLVLKTWFMLITKTWFMRILKTWFMTSLKYIELDSFVFLCL